MENKTRSNSIFDATEIKEIKIMKPSQNKRHSVAKITFTRTGSWGGSVPSFFDATNQEIQIDDTLTPGRRTSLPKGREFQVRDSLTREDTGNWEDQFESRRKLSGPNGPVKRPKIGTIRVVRILRRRVFPVACFTGSLFTWKSRFQYSKYLIQPVQTVNEVFSLFGQK